MTSYFSPTDVVIREFCTHLVQAYNAVFGSSHPDLPEIISWAGSMALEIISHSDALYHNVDHTIHVTLVGLEILRGKHLKQGGVTPQDFLNFTLSLLFHDIGYVKGICKDDNMKELTFADGKGGIVKLAAGTTDASLTPHHVDRGKLFIAERFSQNPLINVPQIQRNIELTRFPVPADDDHKDTVGYPGLVRAADLIGQMSDPWYIRKNANLFYEFLETGEAEKLKLKSIADLRKIYPGFFWRVVHPHIKDALVFLRMTHTGVQYANNLFANVFAVEHEADI